MRKIFGEQNYVQLLFFLLYSPRQKCKLRPTLNEGCGDCESISESRSFELGGNSLRNETSVPEGDSFLDTPPHGKEPTPKSAAKALSSMSRQKASGLILIAVW